MKRVSEEVWIKIREEVSRGVSMLKVARKYGVTPVSVSVRASRGKWRIKELRKAERAAGKALRLAQGEETVRQIQGEVITAAASGACETDAEIRWKLAHEEWRRTSQEKFR